MMSYNAPELPTICISGMKFERGQGIGEGFLEQFSESAVLESYGSQRRIGSLYGHLIEPERAHGTRLIKTPKTI
jgi:hypothetical protein